MSIPRYSCPIPQEQQTLRGLLIPPSAAGHHPQSISTENHAEAVMCGIMCKCLHHSVTHSLPRAEYPGGCWGPLARMNYEAGHSRPGRSSHSQTGPQACLYPPAKGSHHLTVIPTPAAFPTVTLPSFQTHTCAVPNPEALSRG